MQGNIDVHKTFIEKVQETVDATSPCRLNQPISLVCRCPLIGTGSKWSSFVAIITIGRPLTLPVACSWQTRETTSIKEKFNPLYNLLLNPKSEFKSKEPGAVVIESTIYFILKLATFY